MERTKALDLVSVFLVSAGALTYEMALTRLFSLAYWHHFAALVVALALTGFGSAGSILALVLPSLNQRRGSWPALSALLSAGAMLLGYAAAGAVGLEPLELAWSSRAWFQLALVCLILIIPFGLAASHIALVLAWSSAPNKTYAANLAGSGLGSLAAAGMLGFLPPHLLLYPAAGAALLAGAVQTLGLTRKQFLTAGGLVLALALVAAFFPPELRFAAFKDRTAALAASGNRVVHLSWGIQGLLEVISGPAFHHAPGLSLSCTEELPNQAGLFLDGDLTGPITSFRPSPASLGFVGCLLGRVPFELLDLQSALFISPGGGLSLLAGLSKNMKQALAMEDDPRPAALLKGPLAEFSQGLYLDKRIQVRNIDPWTFLHRSEEKFQAVVLGNGTAWGAGGESGLGVTRLLTQEGVGLMLDRLEPGGVLVLSGPLMTPPRASIKLLATAAQAIRNRGGDPEQALALLRDWNTVLVLVKPSGWTTEQLKGLRSLAHERGFDLSWLPDLGEEELNRFHLLPGEPMYRAAQKILGGQERELFRESPFDLRPATRDRPYFFKFLKTTGLSPAKWPSYGPRLAVTEWGLLFLWGGFLAALGAAALGILGPLPFLRPRPPGTAYFSLIGAAYMIAEITLLHEILFLLGRPALAVPLVVGGFLLLSGLGSLAWGGRRPTRFALAAGLILPAALALIRIFNLGPSLSLVLLAPAALVMGVPFAGGLTNLTDGRPSSRAWAFGLNGFFSVAGSPAAALICVQAGHTISILTAGGLYVLAGMACGRSEKWVRV